jgi:hypothetical protein
VHRQADGARLVHDGALDVLPYPPGCIGGKAVATLGVELFQRVHQAKVAFLDQVEQVESAVGVALGDVDHQPQIALDHALARRKVALPHGPRQREFLGRLQKGVLADFVEIGLSHVALHVHQRNGFFRFLLGGLRVEQFGVFAGRAFALGVVRIRHPVLSFARYFIGSTGLPKRRISKWSFTRSVSLLPISPIFCPLATLCPSLTRTRLLCA